jgi:hypothetical protein
MLYAGLDLSRQRLDVCVLDEEGRTIEVTAATPEVFGLRELVARISGHGDEVTAVIESMNADRHVCGSPKRSRSYEVTPGAPDSRRGTLNIGVTTLTGWTCHT